jgi:hypothetical protein
MGSSPLNQMPHPTPPAVESPLPATEGLNRVDQERAASVADEGGAAAATIESQEGGLAVSAPIAPGSLRSKRSKHL